MTIDTTKLRELANKATTGPWEQINHIVFTETGDLEWVVANARSGNSIIDAKYIAAANPATVLALLDELDAANTSRRAAQARVAELTEQVQKMGRELHRHKLDTARLNWLADRENAIGNVQLPAECVLAHPDSMRAAIDAAMAMEVSNG